MQGRDSLIPKIELLKQAIRGQHIVTFQYYYGKGEAKRRIEPYRLVFQWSSWYIFGYCLDRKGYRLFKLNRLWKPELRGETFQTREIPSGALHFADHFQTDTIHLKALFEESEKYRLIDEYGVDCYTVCPDGRLLLEQDFACYENMREWVFGFGDKADIIEPERLKADRIQQARNIINNAVTIPSAHKGSGNQ